MRKPIIVGNWKMNNGPEEAHKFYHELGNLINSNEMQNEISSRVDWAIAAPYLSLGSIMAHSHKDNEEELEDMSNEEASEEILDEELLYIPLAAQNVHQNESGAFTGEISISMLQEYGIEYVIIGHSERREMFNETDEIVNAKVKAVAKTLDSEEDYIIPIVAYGETEKEFDDGKTLEVVRNQLTIGLQGLNPEHMEKIVLAYEPIWAIGTGKTATPEQAQSVIKASRDIVAEMYGNEVAEKVRIQYGGSMNPGNVKELMAQPDIDGGLVGGASLKADSLFELLNYNK